ncbi:MAG TPA: GGDEF domain-containing protein [Spirochaetota bacterium]|nr:GGDEF domain-containing protein [Spirochaetota bacterium]
MSSEDEQRERRWVLNDSRRKRIGLLIDNIVNISRYQSSLWEGILSATRARDIDVVCICGGSLYSSPTNPYERRRNSVFEIIEREDFDGLIVSGSLITHCHRDDYERFFSRFKGLPLVCVGSLIAGFPSVMLTNYEGAKEAVNHLIREHGKTRIVYIRGSLNMFDQSERYRGYCDALNENGIPLDLDLVIPGDFSPEAGQKIVRELIDRNISFDAVASVNDGMILGVSGELRKRGIRVPEDVALCGFDDIEDTAICIPSITTVHQAVGDLGAAAVEMLHGMLEGTTVPDSEYVKTRLVIRESCGCSVGRPVRPDFSGCNAHDQDQAEHAASAAHATAKTDLAERIAVRIGSQYDRDQIIAEIRELSDAFESDVKEMSSESVFMRKLSGVLTERMDSGKPVLEWYDAVKTIAQNMLPRLEGEDEKRYLFSLCDSGMYLVADMARRAPTIGKMKMEMMSEMLMVTGAAIGSIYNIDLLAEAVIGALPSYDIQDFMLFLCESDGEIAPTEDLLGEKYRLVAAVRNGEAVPVPPQFVSMPGTGFMNRLFDFCAATGMKQVNLLVEPVFFREYNFGIVVFPGDIRNSLVFETLGRQIGSSLMGGLLYREQQKAELDLLNTLKELEASNCKLEQLSTIDELTGLYNRRGFYTYAEHQRVLSKRMGKGFLLFYADMDNLKMINDRYGHNDGDRAIRAVADILKSAFRRSDIISRVGGDEFVIISADTLANGAGTIIDKITVAVKNFNSRRVLPYDVGLTMGFAEYDPASDDQIDQMMITADGELYENKKKKKSTVK